MPLFVPALRLLMLFLNVYDSYKTLKDPPPSSRNGGRPTVRAVSQRKRDMKGCLAVWIVWTSLAIYERTVESLISLFIPFYDEIKSLVLLFLILTRARGAEPIYLHVIRPFVKPYTRTLDAALDIMLTFGDFIFALSTYPLRLALRWWQRRFGKYYEPFETEADSQSELSSNEVNTSEVPSSILASSAPGLPPLPPDPPEAAGVQLPSKASQGKRPADSQARRPSQDRLSRIAGARGNSQAGPSHSLPRKRKDSDNRSESGAESTTRHQIWYPPQAAYADEDPEEEAQANLTIKPSVQAPEPPKDANATLNEAQRLVELQQLDEWRQYPPFPSAYPPTPIATTARLIPSSMALPSSLYPPIEEEMAQQDFRQSLLPPREPLNPTHAGDSSDRDNTNFGIYHYLANQQLAKDTDDSISTSDDYEDEDEDAFNVTLRTPLPPQGSARSQIYSRRFVSLASASSMASVPSRSSALTTVDSLRTQTSSDSSSAPGPAMLSSTVIGKKRSYPKTRPLNTKNRVRQVEDEGSEEGPKDLSDSEPPKPTSASRHPPPTRKLTSDTIRPLASPSDTADDVLTPSSVSSHSDTEDQAAEGREEQEEHDPAIPPEEKRRKVVRSQHLRAVTASRPVRPRVAKYASPPPKQPLKLRPTESLAAARPKRGALRLKAGSSASAQAKTKEMPTSSSGASSPASASAGASHSASTKLASGTTSRRK